MNTINADAVKPDPAQFDHFDQAYADNPDPVWRALRSIAGIPKSDKHDGFRMVTRYDDICAAARNPELFCSSQGVAIPAFPFPKLIPVETDPPLHHQYRKILTTAMSPTAVMERTAEIQVLSDELLTPLVGRTDVVDYCEAFATPFPQYVALRVIGFPDDDRPTLGPWMHTLTHLRGIDDAAVMTAGLNVIGRIAEFIGQRRDRARADDLVSRLLDADVDGRPIEDQEITLYILLLLFGGLDTTSSAIAGSIYYLARHPGLRRSLLHDEIAMDRAVDEFIRWTTPIQAIGRTVTQDTELGGCPLSAGERVLLMWGSGNRDETVFDDAADIVIDRAPNRHLSFGMGPHRCIGSHLAKTMVKVAIERTVELLGDFSLPEGHTPRWAMGEARGLAELPLTLRAAR